MAIFDLYSKRQKRLRGEVPDIFTYDVIPNTLRVQIVHIIRDSIGYNDNHYNTDKPSNIYQQIRDVLCREYGKFQLRKNSSRYGKDSVEEELLNFFLETESTDEALDVIEITFKSIEKLVLPNYYEFQRDFNTKTHPNQAIQDLNNRFKENAVGYSFDGNEIIRVDSIIMHNEVTKPTIALTWNNKFLGANEEYLKAHNHYKNGDNKECLNECLKAFESTIKTICLEKKWSFSSNATAKSLIQICFDNELIPSFTQSQFTSLRSLLESGIPTIRNKLGGHGQGQVPQKVDDEMTRYALNLTGANIIFLIEQSEL